MSDPLRPEGLQPTRVLCPWDSPGRDTGVGCHALLQGSSRQQDETHVSGVPCTGRRILHTEPSGKPCWVCSGPAQALEWCCCWLQMSCAGACSFTSLCLGSSPVSGSKNTSLLLLPAFFLCLLTVMIMKIWQLCLVVLKGLGLVHLCSRSILRRSRHRRCSADVWRLREWVNEWTLSSVSEACSRVLLGSGMLEGKFCLFSLQVSWYVHTSRSTWKGPLRTRRRNGEGFGAERPTMLPFFIPSVDSPKIK